jgi:hypothetical protein
MGAKKEINSKFQFCKLGQETFLDKYYHYHYSLVTVVVRSQALVCGYLPAENVVSNPTRTWVIVASVVCRQIEVSATS